MTDGHGEGASEVRGATSSFQRFPRGRDIALEVKTVGFALQFEGKLKWIVFYFPGLANVPVPEFNSRLSKTKKTTNMAKQQVDGREDDRDTQGAREGGRVHTETSTNGPLRKSRAIQHSRPGAHRSFD